MSAIAELEQDRIVEAVYAVAKKERLRTKGGAPYLALELVDPSGRIEARVWNDVELLDSRFAEVDPAEDPHGVALREAPTRRALDRARRRPGSRSALSRAATRRR